MDVGPFPLIGKRELFLFSAVIPAPSYGRIVVSCKSNRGHPIPKCIVGLLDKMAAMMRGVRVLQSCVNSAILKNVLPKAASVGVLHCHNTVNIPQKRNFTQLSQFTQVSSEVISPFITPELLPMSLGWSVRS